MFYRIKNSCLFFLSCRFPASFLPATNEDRGHCMAASVRAENTADGGEGGDNDTRVCVEVASDTGIIDDAPQTEI